MRLLCPDCEQETPHKFLRWWTRKIDRGGKYENADAVSISCTVCWRVGVAELVNLPTLQVAEDE